jgi:hypothetical protein
MRDPVIVSAVRRPIGSFIRGLASFSARGSRETALGRIWTGAGPASYPLFRALPFGRCIDD